MPGLEPLDWLLIALYGAVVIGVGVRSNRRQKSTEDYVLGGRTLPWWAVGVSLIATSFSSAALIGGTSFGYARGMSYLQLQIGDLLAVLDTDGDEPGVGVQAHQSDGQRTGVALQVEAAGGETHGNEGQSQSSNQYNPTAAAAAVTATVPLNQAAVCRLSARPRSSATFVAVPAPLR